MKKVRLTSYTKDDLQFLHELLSDEQTKKYLSAMYTATLEESNLRLKGRLVDQEYEYANIFLIKELLTNTPVGEISGRLSLDNPEIMEIAVLVHPAHRGKGFAKAGIIEFMKHIAKNNKDISKFRMEIADDNFASIAVAKKTEFKFTKQENDNMKYYEKDAR